MFRKYFVNSKMIYSCIMFKSWFTVEEKYVKNKNEFIYYITLFYKWKKNWNHDNIGIRVYLCITDLACNTWILIRIWCVSACFSKQLKRLKIRGEPSCIFMSICERNVTYKICIRVATQCFQCGKNTVTHPVCICYGYMNATHIRW